MSQSRPGYLLLKDGRRFDGILHGEVGERGLGEVVFQTGMTGYQEVITDPSYCGQIVTFTTSHIGNTGVTQEDNEAPAPALAGVVVRSLCHRPSNWRSQKSVGQWLEEHGIPCLEGVDTRAVTRHIRREGAVGGILVPRGQDEAARLERLQGWAGLEGADLTGEVMPDQERPYSLWPELPPGEELAEVIPVPEQSSVGAGLRLTMVHAGMKQGIEACMRRRGAEVRVVRADSPAESWLEGDPHGIVLSNGPGDPAASSTLIESVRSVIGRVPLLGVCLGFQVLALALGARTGKMKHGHHGVNHPVSDLKTGRVLVTSQNHGFEVLEDTLPAGCAVTHRSLNDRTLEGFEHTQKRVFAVQFHPEARGGPHDASPIFDHFLAGLQS